MAPTGIPRMRTVKRAIDELRKLDSGTDLTEKALRRMISDGTVPSVRVGTKRLINIDLLLEILASGDYNDGAIRVL